MAWGIEEGWTLNSLARRVTLWILMDGAMRVSGPQGRGSIPSRLTHLQAHPGSRNKNPAGLLTGPTINLADSPSRGGEEQYGLGDNT